MTKVVIVSTSASEFAGHHTGVWLEEIAAAFYVLKDAGITVEVASPKGGPIPIDAASMADGFFTEPCKKFMHDGEAIGALSHSTPLKDVNWTDVAAVYLPGGHGTCVDFLGDPVKSAVEKMYADDKIVATVCHGPIALCDCKKPDGTPLVAGKTVAGFSNTEEEAVKIYLEKVPFLLESKLVELGGKYEKADDWHSKICVDGKLITGQNPQSSEAAAKKLVEMLS